MRVTLLFSLVILAVNILTACEQMYTRLSADSNAIAERFTPHTILPSDTAITKPIIDSGVETQSVPIQAQVPITPTDKTFASSNASTLDTQFSRRVITESKSPVDADARLLVKKNTPSFVVQMIQMPVDSDLTEASNESYHRANSNQVILRNGEISIDFSKDMPVINSKNGIDLNSR